MKKTTSIKIVLVILAVAGIHKCAWSSASNQSPVQSISPYIQQFARSEALSLFYRSFKTLEQDPLSQELPVCQTALKTFKDLQNNFVNNGGMIILTQLVNDPLFKNLVTQKNKGCEYIQQGATTITHMFFAFQKTKPTPENIDTVESLLYNTLKTASLTNALVQEATQHPQGNISLALNAFSKEQQTFFVEGGKALSIVITNPEFIKAAQNNVALQSVISDFMFAEMIYKFAQTQTGRKK